MFFLLSSDIALNISVIAGVDIIEKNLSTLTSLVCWHTICCKNVKSVSCLLNTQSSVCLRRDLKIFLLYLVFYSKFLFHSCFFRFAGEKTQTMTCSSEKKNRTDGSCVMVWRTIIEVMTRCNLCNCPQRHHMCYSTQHFEDYFKTKDVEKNYAIPMWHEVKFSRVIYQIWTSAVLCRHYDNLNFYFVS